MSSPNRLHVVDALRGFAIVSIMLLHNIEHFDFYYLPENLPDWMVALDKGVWDTLFFLFGGKSYAIFALLFGLTYFIQTDNQRKKGKDFRGRFAWRLLLLLGFGIINSTFYMGDILFVYALLGFTLIPVTRLSNKTVFTIALILMAQPVEIIKLIYGIIYTPQLADPASWVYYEKIPEYLSSESIFTVLKGNIMNGKIAVLLWTWEYGRVFQTISLFMFGMLAGRYGIFGNSDSNAGFWKKVLLISIIAFIPLFYLKSNIMEWITTVAVNRPLELIIRSWANMAFMLILVSGFVLLFKQKAFHNKLNVLSAYGKMSMSNYILQSILGSFIYYGFGLGLYKYTGATYSLIIGLVLALIQGIFSTWWMKNHKQGPLESIWHKLTWIGK